MAEGSRPPVDEEPAAPTQKAESLPSAGFGSHLLDRAKAARDRAEAQVSGLASVAGEAAASRAADLKSQVAAKAGELRDAGLGKIVDVLDDFNAALPVIREAGYTLSSVDIGVGLPPKVTASFVASSAVSPENVERLMAEHAEKKFTLLLVKALYQAWQLQTKIKIVGLQPKGLSVEVGLIPAVTVKFA